MDAVLREPVLPRVDAVLRERRRRVEGGRGRCQEEQRARAPSTRSRRTGIPSILTPSRARRETDGRVGPAGPPPRRSALRRGRPPGASGGGCGSPSPAGRGRPRARTSLSPQSFPVKVMLVGVPSESRKPFGTTTHGCPVRFVRRRELPPNVGATKRSTPERHSSISRIRSVRARWARRYSTAGMSCPWRKTFGQASAVCRTIVFTRPSRTSASKAVAASAVRMSERGSTGVFDGKLQRDELRPELPEDVEAPPVDLPPLGGAGLLLLRLRVLPALLLEELLDEADRQVLQAPARRPGERAVGGVRVERVLPLDRREDEGAVPRPTGRSRRPCPSSRREPSPRAG